jgi:hypothetical protein
MPLEVSHCGDSINTGNYFTKGHFSTKTTVVAVTAIAEP